MSVYRLTVLRLLLQETSTVGRLLCLDLATTLHSIDPFVLRLHLHLFGCSLILILLD